MKLHELKELKATTLVEEMAMVWQDQGQLDEGIWDSLKTGFSQIANTITQVSKSSNSKGELNDRILRQMYIDELEKFSVVFTKAPDKVKAKISSFLGRAGIKLSGVDLSRKNLNRIMILKVLRLILFAIAQMRDNGIQWLLSSIVTAGLSNIINLLMNAKDIKDVGSEMVNTGKQLKTLFDKANNISATPPDEQNPS